MHQRLTTFSSDERSPEAFESDVQIRLQHQTTACGSWASFATQGAAPACMRFVIASKLTWNMTLP